MTAVLFNQIDILMRKSRPETANFLPGRPTPRAPDFHKRTATSRRRTRNYARRDRKTSSANVVPRFSQRAALSTASFSMTSSNSLISFYPHRVIKTHEDDQASEHTC